MSDVDDFYEEDADISSPTGTSVRAKSPDFKAEAPPSNPPAHKPEPPVITNDLKVTSSPAKKEASKRRPIEFPAEFVSSEPVVPAKDSNRSDDGKDDQDRMRRGRSMGPSEAATRTQTSSRDRNPELRWSGSGAPWCTPAAEGKEDQDRSRRERSRDPPEAATRAQTPSRDRDPELRRPGRNNSGVDLRQAHTHHVGGPTKRYIGLVSNGRSELVWAAQTGLWAPKGRARELLDNAWRSGDDVTLIFQDGPSDFIMGYAKLLSGLLPEGTVVSPFSSPGPLVRIEFKYLGEYSKQMFADMGRIPGRSPLMSFTDGYQFVSGLGRDAVQRMEAMAAAYKLPKPLTVARRWIHMYSIPPSAVQQQSLFSGMRMSPHMNGDAHHVGRGNSLPPSHEPAAPRGGGFIMQVAGEGVAKGAERPRPPPIKVPVVPSAAAAQSRVAVEAAEQRLARKKLVEMSYEEYLVVFGRVQEEWRQRQLQESLVKASAGGVSTEEQFIQQCRHNGRMNVSDATLRAEYRRMIAEHATLGRRGMVR